MTWVLGSVIPPFGYGVLISDIRVSWPDGRFRDELQKVHSVGPGLMAGFAGSVPLGFALIEDMRQAFAPPNDLREAAERWSLRGQRAFSSSPPQWQAARVAVLLVGFLPERNGASCLRMMSPDFKPELASEMSWLSIGSGSAHSRAAAYLQGHPRESFLEHFGGLEVADPGRGIARSTAINVSMALKREPLVSVSNTIQFAVMGTYGFEIDTLQSLDPNSFEPEEPDNPLVTSWGDFAASAEKAVMDCNSAITCL